MLVGGIAADEEDRRRVCNFAQARGFVLMSGERSSEGDVIGCALVVDVAGAEDGAREFLKEVVFFVGGAVGTDDSDCGAAASVADFFELCGGDAEGMLPTDGFELAL